MEDLEHIIGQHPFFRNLEPSYLTLLVSCASNQRFEPGAYIFREGGEANHFYLLRAGHVAIEMMPGRNHAVNVATLTEGDILGWSWLLPPYHWKHHARALDSVRALALDGKCLRTKCEQNHDLGYELLKRFAQVIEQRLEATRLQLLDVYAMH
jgi:CRP-like cAMP-binding protein